MRKHKTVTWDVTAAKNRTNKQTVKSKEKVLNGLCISGMSMPAKLRTHFEVPEHKCKVRVDNETVALHSPSSRWIKNETGRQNKNNGKRKTTERRSKQSRVT